MIEYLEEYLKINDVEYKRKQKLSQYSLIKIGGEAEIVAYPDSEDKLVDLISFCKRIGLKHKVVGNMSNLLPLDDGYDGLVIKADKLNSCKISGNRVTAGSGVKIPGLASKLSSAGLSGVEGLSGIPGQIGGSVRGNAGAFGREISDVILSATLYSPDLDDSFVLSASELDFSYRTSRLARENLVLLSAEFKLTESDRVSVLYEMQRCREIRKRTQPTEYPSLGSFFKRPEDGVAAAKLIDECGLKGMRVGDASVSEKHAGFIINLSNATSSEVLSLASYIEEAVYNRFSVKLKREVEILN